MISRKSFTILRDRSSANLQSHDFAAPVAITASATITTTDSDNDGLSDADEAYWGTCDGVTIDERCDGVADSTDSDGDGLSDGVEVNDLGIIPTAVDSDNDGINDKREVESFSYGGQTWQLNPFDEDTNKDGVIDGLECIVWTDMAGADKDETADCPDTDNDLIPDLFDDDNDNDGVKDADDFSPNAVSSETYDGDNPFLLTVDNLELDRPVFVDLQFRPTVTDNLTLYNHVLDWPTGDTQGQVQRYLDTTWADATNPELRSTADNAANGDIRLVPMLEVIMPYSAGHYANLPITTTASANRIIGRQRRQLD